MILLDGERLVVIDREEPGRPPYTVFPGGGIDAGETPAAAARREALEELGAVVELDETSPLVVAYPDHDEWYFPARVATPGSSLNTGKDSTRRAVRLEPAHVANRSLLPTAAADVALRAWLSGHWWEGRCDVVEPSALDPVRVRAGAIVVADRRIALIDCPRNRLLEIPGGGVEPGEDVVAAAVRELREETGIDGRAVREVAEVYKDGRREHYLIVDAGGRPFAASGFDLEAGERPVWKAVADLPRLPVWPKRLAWRVAHWAEHGWPEHPVVLADTVLDLDAPCCW